LFVFQEGFPSKLERSTNSQDGKHWVLICFVYLKCLVLSCWQIWRRDFRRWYCLFRSIRL